MANAYVRPFSLHVKFYASAYVYAHAASKNQARLNVIVSSHGTTLPS